MFRHQPARCQQGTADRHLLSGGSPTEPWRPGWTGQATCQHENRTLAAGRQSSTVTYSAAADHSQMRACSVVSVPVATSWRPSGENAKL